MGSRRRPNLTTASNDELSTASSSNTYENTLQLLPTIKDSDARKKLNIEDYLGHQKWHFKRKPAIHPALTDFGPDSLRRFLQNEISRAAALASSVRNKQEQEFRDLARSLVNAETGLYSVKEDGKTVMRIQTLEDQTLVPPEDLSPLDRHGNSIREGKKPSVRVPQSDGVEDMSIKPNIPLPGSMALPRISRSTTSLRDTLRLNLTDSDLGKKESMAKPVRMYTTRCTSVELPLQVVDSNRRTARSSRHLLDAKESSEISESQDRALHEVSPFNENTVLGTYTSTEAHVASATPTSTTVPDRLIGKARSILSRTSSFENHASHSRDSMRSNAKSFESCGDCSLNEPRRRRKTPSVSQAHPHVQPSSLPDLGHHTAASVGKGPPTLQDPMFLADQTDPLPSAGSSQTSARRQSNNLHTLNPALLNISFNSYGSPQDDFGLEQLLSDDDDDVMMADEDFSTVLMQQKAILESIKAQAKVATSGSLQHYPKTQTRYEYSQIAPEDMPPNVRQAEINRCTIWHAHGFDGLGRFIADKQSDQSGTFTVEQLDPLQQNILRAPDEFGDYPRRCINSYPLTESSEPSTSSPPTEPKIGLPIEIWDADTGKTPGGVLQYLSSLEVRNLRLVCKNLADDLAPYLFRNVVTKFDPCLFSLYPAYSEDGRLLINAHHSMIQKYGADMNKFGIAFEVDTRGLMHAPFKVTETTVNAWFGKYMWPVRDYPYFTSLREIDKLLDDERRLLTQVMKSLTKCRELAISVDSGHGWLEGPDMSDLALYRSRARGGSKVFGKTFRAPDRHCEDGLKELFRWAQINSINENVKYLDKKSPKSCKEFEVLQAIAIRDYDSYRSERDQPDFTESLHTGGVAGSTPATQPPNPGPPNLHTFLANNTNFFAPTTAPGPILPTQATVNQNQLHQFDAVMNLVHTREVTASSNKKGRKNSSKVTQPQWPIIFNGFNLAAESRGDSDWVQSRVAIPSSFPLLPNCLTEPQAQWLMETSWIQRTFLSAYIDAVRLNSAVLSNVHSLHISKLSSGLLPALSHRSFWSALKGLRKITILVKPDWQLEHVPGDKFFQSNMTTEPVNAAYKLTELLQDHIVPLENLNSLHVGYLGGGEQQAGIFGRNQHILPAPITQHPHEWLVAQNPAQTKPDLNTIITFPHVRTLTFENCWFSPLLLEHFMIKSRDSSLHNLVLNSVSLTAQINSTRTDGPLRTAEHQLKCEHSSVAWLHEMIPTSASWFNVLNKITPGQTLLDHKYDAGMINEEENPRPEKSFRGNIEQISLRSCGYVKVLGISSNDFNQNELVFQHAQWVAMDDGLKAYANRFTKTFHHDSTLTAKEDDKGKNSEASHTGRRRRQSSTNSIARSTPSSAVSPRSQRQQPKDSRPKVTTRFIMLSGRSAHVRGESISANDEVSHVSALTGYLTQCIHPVEKRTLENMWGMKFGWGDDMKRWEAVEDGWFMGGTGRFSGDIFKDSSLQAVTLPVPDDEDDNDDDEAHGGDHCDDQELSSGSSSAQANVQLNPSN